MGRRERTRVEEGDREDGGDTDRSTNRREEKISDASQKAHNV